MALLTVHPCDFNFDDVDIRRVGNTIDGGTSIDGTSNEIEADGGGYIQADFTNGEALDLESALKWRALTDTDGGEKLDVLLCAERFTQPVLDRASTATPRNVVIDNHAPDKGAAYAATSSAVLRATTISIAGTSEKPLQPGMLFSIPHPNWGWRAYRVRSVDGNTLTFRPPLREAITAGTALEFDNPRCQMVIVQKASNPTNIGLYTSCAISFVEDMAPPPSP